MKWYFAQNADYLARTGKLYEVRAVIVPDLYDTEKSIREMGDFLSTLSGIRRYPDQDHCLPASMGRAGAIFPFPGAGPEIPVLSGRYLKSKGFQNIILIQIKKIQEGPPWQE